MTSTPCFAVARGPSSPSSADTDVAASMAVSSRTRGCRRRGSAFTASPRTSSYLPRDRSRGRRCRRARSPAAVDLDDRRVRPSRLGRAVDDHRIGDRRQGGRRARWCVAPAGPMLKSISSGVGVVGRGFAALIASRSEQCVASHAPSSDVVVRVDHDVRAAVATARRSARRGPARRTRRRSRRRRWRSSVHRRR